MTGVVMSSGDTSESFCIPCGVKQGCVLAPVLSTYSTCNSYAICNNLNHRASYHWGVIADDCAHPAHTEEQLQIVSNKFAEASKLFGLTISLEKTEALLQPTPDCIPCQPSIPIGINQLRSVESFKYLGSTIFNDGSLERESQGSSKIARLLGD